MEKPLDPPGHSFTNYVSDNNATCTEDGTKTAKCDRCDATDTIPDPGTAKGHTWSTWITDQEANYGKDGHKFRVCTVCSEKDEEVIPGLEQTINPFADINTNKWYSDGVIFCYANGYMSGTSESEFSPDVVMNRAMFATILSKIDGADTFGYTGSSFKDVPEGKWYSNPIEWAFRNGYASGSGNGNYSPDAPVTRETLAQFLYNYSQKKGYDVSGSADISGFPDAVTVSGWATNAVKWAIKVGLISGVKIGDDVLISPKTNASRAQVALIVMNYGQIKNSANG